MRHLLMFAILASAISATQASSPDAWKELYRTTGTACLQKSGLKNPKVIEGPTVFSHAVLYRIRDTWPQPHMKGKPDRVYCLHAYPHGEPEIVESR